MIYLLSLLVSVTLANDIKVMLIDTGVDNTHPALSKYVVGDVEDDHGHGTHLAGIILYGDLTPSQWKSIKNNTPFILPPPVCNNLKIISCKYYYPHLEGNLEREIFCLEKAIKYKVNYVNLSSGGSDFSTKEFDAINRLSVYKIKMVVAAGNERSDLKKFSYFPATYPGLDILVVGGLNREYKQMVSSNYGLKTLYWQIGENVYSTLPKNSFGYMTGTSQATALQLHYMLKEKCGN